MLKRTKFVFFSTIFTLLFCLLIDIVFNPVFSALEIAYLFIFSLLAIFLILRGLTYKIDTNLYLGILLFISPALQLLIHFNIKNYAIYALAILSIMSLASLSVWKYFNDSMHKNFLFILLGEIAIFILPFCLTKISFWYLIILSVLWIFCFFVTKKITKKTQIKKKIKENANHIKK